MANYIYPAQAPMPRSMLAWDGTDFRVPSCTTAARLRVTGEDQLFSYHSQIMGTVALMPAAAGNNTLTGAAVPAGRIWIITAMEAHDDTSPVTSIRFGVGWGGVPYWFSAVVGPAAGIGRDWQGHLYLVQGDFCVALLTGCVAGDAIVFHYAGYAMTLD